MIRMTGIFDMLRDFQHVQRCFGRALTERTQPNP